MSSLETIFENEVLVLPSQAYNDGLSANDADDGYHGSSDDGDSCGIADSTYSGWSDDESSESSALSLIAGANSEGICLRFIRGLFAYVPRFGSDAKGRPKKTSSPLRKLKVCLVFRDDAGTHLLIDRLDSPAVGSSSPLIHSVVRVEGYDAWQLFTRTTTTVNGVGGVNSILHAYAVFDRLEEMWGEIKMEPMVWRSVEEAVEWAGDNGVRGDFRTALVDRNRLKIEEGSVSESIEL